MLTRVSAWSRSVKGVVSRSEWLARLLRLSRAEGAAATPGLILIQIDGLSRTQLHRALHRRELPFLQTLIRREHYTNHPMYAGVPASTPAFQAELFYGVKTAVPAFSYRDRDTRRIFTMYRPKDAAEVERRLQQRGEPLLKGGSSYTDIFTGGADEPHYCASGTEWTRLLRTINPLVLPIILLMHLDIIVRTACLMVLEWVLGFLDCFRGILTGKTLLEEVHFALCRAATCILLREVVVVGAKVDIARGLPIVHVNFVGYDEQAHRRGPSSRFAHWSLRGIDWSVARLWRAAMSSRRRAYDVWIYSDHGQEDALPYAEVHGQSIESVVTNVIERFSEQMPMKGPPPLARSSWQTRWRHSQALQPMCCSEHQQETIVSDEPRVAMTAMGSLGHIYPTRDLTADEADRLAHELVEHANIPLILAADGPDRARAWTADGEYALPNDAERLFGADHPYLRDVARDLVDVCHHPDAGSLVMSGWQRGGPPLSFPIENGSHTGPGREEINAFALLPTDAPLRPPATGALRATHLREAVLRLLGRAGDDDTVTATEAAPTTVRIMTYNVHNCLGTDGKLSPDRIARVIARHRPDIVALQELDVRRPRSGGVDQAQFIAKKLNMELHFHPAMSVEEEQYGNAVLSRFPTRLVRAGLLPGWRNWPDTEPRGALWVSVQVDGHAIQLINSHLSLWPREQVLQVAKLLGPDWLGSHACTGPVILCGDLNAVPRSYVCRRLASKLRDAQAVLSDHRPLGTWSGRYPMRRIDHVFVDDSIDIVNIDVPRTELEKTASDHLPLIVEFRVKVGSLTSTHGQKIEV